MSDYGMKVTKKGVSALGITTPADLIMTTRYPFAKIDPTTPTSFQTIDISFLSTPTSGVETLVYQFTHGYNYTPQSWGLWNVTYPASASWVLYDQAYGTYLSTVSAGVRSLKARYSVTDTSVFLYITATNGAVDPINIVGFTVRLTMYIFVDDLQEASYI